MLHISIQLVACCYEQHDTTTNASLACMSQIRYLYVNRGFSLLQFIQYFFCINIIIISSVIHSAHLNSLPRKYFLWHHVRLGIFLMLSLYLSFIFLLYYFLFLIYLLSRVCMCVHKSNSISFVQFDCQSLASSFVHHFYAVLFILIHV